MTSIRDESTTEIDSPRSSLSECLSSDSAGDSDESNTTHPMKVNAVVRNRNKDKTQLQSQPFNSTVKVENSTGNLHLGTQIIYNGPVYIENLTKQAILSINEECKTCDENNKNLTVLSQMKGVLSLIWGNIIKSNFFQNLTVKQLMRICFLIILTTVFIFSLRYIKYGGKKLSLGEKCHREGFDVTKLNDIYKTIFKFISRHTWEGSEIDKRFIVPNTSIVYDKCTYDPVINVKTKLRFVIPKDLTIKHIGEQEFDYFSNIYDELKRNLNNNFHDLFYNYIILLDDNILEGRPLACPFDELFLNSDHSDVIIVAIPFCFPDLTTKGYYIHQMHTWTLEPLLKVLIDKGILIKNYHLEYPKLCNSNLGSLNETLKREHLSFYESDCCNLTTRLNKNTMYNLIFKPIEDFLTDVNVNVTSLNLNSSLLPEVDFCSLDYNPLYKLEVEKPIITFIQGFSRDLNFTNCTKKEDCRILLNSLKDIKNKWIADGINYVVHFGAVENGGEPFLYKLVPINCPPYDETLDGLYLKRFTVNILHIYPPNEAAKQYPDSDDQLESFSFITKDISLDIQRQNIEYSDPTISFDCRSYGDDESYQTKNISLSNKLAHIYREIIRGVDQGLGMIYNDGKYRCRL